MDNDVWQRPDGFSDRRGGATSAGRRTAIPAPVQKTVDFLTLHPRSYDPDWKPTKENPELYPYRQYDRPVDRIKHYVSDDPATVPEDEPQWSSQWLQSHPDEPPEDDADFSAWLFRSIPDTEWHRIPHPGAPWTDEQRQRNIDFRREHRHPDDLWIAHRVASTGGTMDTLNRFLALGPREFIAEQNTDDREELLFRARRHAATLTSTWPQEASAQVVAAFAAGVDKLASRRPRRQASRPVTHVPDFPDSLFFGVG